MKKNKSPKAPAFSDNTYLDLLKKCLTRSIFEDEAYLIAPTPSDWKAWVFSFLKNLLEKQGYSVLKRTTYDPELRLEGKDWPLTAETMVGLKRLDNIQACAEDVIKRKIKGDFIETGVWRGGSVILMAAILKTHHDRQRKVWVADSFSGLPKPNEEKYQRDAGDTHWQMEPLAVSLAEVKNNFKRYGLLGKNVRFLKGWFKDTLPSAPIKNIALLRLDGDMYESTMDALNALYHKLSVGGYIIIDDYYALPNCAAAVEDFRREHGITTRFHRIDWTGVYWRKEK